MGKEAVIGVDIGTSTSKGVLVSPDGSVLRTATRMHDAQRPRPGRVEMDGRLWWSEFVAIVRELISGEDVRILAVGVSGMGPCVLVTDSQSRPLRAAILYGVDTRAVRQIERLNAQLGEEAIIDRCGSRLSTQAVGPKLAWVADEEPEVAAEARLLFMPSTWLAHQLTGEYVLDHHSASQCTPLYDLVRNEWYEPWWKLIAPRIRAPRLVQANEVVGAVTEGAAAETGLPAGVPVVAGTIDAWSEAVSIGAVAPGDVMLMYGTTMFLISTVVELLRSPTLWSTNGATAGTRCLAGGMATSGAITSWLGDLFGGRDYGALTDLARRSSPGAEGLLMLPYFAGERTPIADPLARGVIVGLSLSHTRGDLYRAALEATAFGARHNLEAMRAAGAPLERIVAVGGGTTGSLWTQIVSDVTGREQEIPTHTIGASFGAAFLAAGAVADPTISAWNPVRETCRPRGELAGLYEERYRLYRDLYPATSDIAHALAAQQEG